MKPICSNLIRILSKDTVRQEGAGLRGKLILQFRHLSSREWLERLERRNWIILHRWHMSANKQFQINRIADFFWIQIIIYDKSILFNVQYVRDMYYMWESRVMEFEVRRLAGSWYTNTLGGWCGLWLRLWEQLWYSLS